MDKKSGCSAILIFTFIALMVVVPVLISKAIITSEALQTWFKVWFFLH